MQDLNKSSDRADVLRAITAATPHVNYIHKDRFISALRNDDYVAAWNAVFEAGRIDGKREIAQAWYQQEAGG